MVQFLALFKVELSGLFNFGKIRQYRKESAIKTVFMAISIIVLVVMMAAYIGGFAWMFAQLGLYSILLPMGFVMCSLLNLFTTIYKAGGNLFDSKDFDLVMSLPVSSRVIVLSKVAMMYILDLCFVIVFMVPIFVIYSIFTGFNMMSLIYFILTLLITPIIPLVVGLILGFMITFFAKRFKYANILTIVLTFIAVMIVYSFAFLFKDTTQMTNEAGLVNMTEVMVETFNYYYPLTILYANSVLKHSLVDFGLFAGLSVAAFIMVIWIVSRYYGKLSLLAKGNVAKGVYKITTLKTNTLFKALYSKELKKYISSSTYVVNTSIGCVICLFFALAYTFFPPADIKMIVSNSAARQLLITAGPYLISLMLGMCCITASSISNEAKQLWLIKSLPLKVSDLYKAKIALNLTFTIPTAIIASICLILALSPTPQQRFQIIALPISIAICQSVWGLWFNVNYPKYNWTTEINLYKQSFSVVVVMMSSMLIMLGFFMAAFFMRGNGDVFNYVALVGFITFTMVGWIRLRNKPIKN